MTTTHWFLYHICLPSSQLFSSHLYVLHYCYLSTATHTTSSCHNADLSTVHTFATVCVTASLITASHMYGYHSLAPVSQLLTFLTAILLIAILLTDSTSQLSTSHLSTSLLPSHLMISYLHVILLTKTSAPVSSGGCRYGTNYLCIIDTLQYPYTRIPHIVVSRHTFNRERILLSLS